jgi:uncharacterized delta-60 repeat protein
VALMVLVGCDESPQEPEIPPLDLQYIQREWLIAQFLDPDPPDTLETDIHGTGELRVERKLGEMIIYPPGQGPEAKAEVFSSETGETYWVGAQAPTDSGPSIGGAAQLVQIQSFRKTSEDASLQYVVSETILEMLDDNGTVPTLDECPAQRNVFPIEEECGDMMVAAVDFDLEVLRYNYEPLEGANEINVDSIEVFHIIRGLADFYGFRENFLYRAMTYYQSDQPLWDRSDFDPIADPLGEDRGGQIRLRSAITIDIPLDSLPVGTLFDVTTVVSAQAYTRRQRESYVSAYFRDPLKAAGLSSTHKGLQSLDPLDGRPTVVGTPPCTGNATPPTGTLHFDTIDFREAERPNGRAWVTVARSGGSQGIATARFATSDGTAVAGSDYQSVETYVVFADGELGSRVALIPILSDTLIEDDETVQLTLTEIPGCGTLGTPATATITILDDDDPPEPPTYIVGGTVTGLIGTDLMLTNLSDDLVLSASGPFAFDREYVSGLPYDVRVATQPSAPTQVCTVSNGSGHVTDADITDILVDCVTPPPDDGGLDPGFGVDGKATTGSMRGASDMALQSDGKMVLVGGNLLARYDGSGNLDPSFGTDGEVTVRFNNVSGQLYGVAVQSDGRIVAAGRVQEPAGLTDLNVAVARFNGDGSLDAGFGVDGTVTTDFQGGADGAYDIVIQPDGAIVVGGLASVVGGADFAVVRYTADGALDTTFGIDGKVTTNIAGQTDLGYAMALQTDGKIVLAGGVANSGGTDPDVGLVRYAADGTLDTGFGVGGIVRIVTDNISDEAAGVAVQPDGKIVIAGLSRALGDTYRFLLMRLDGGGVLDPGFGGTGIVTDALSQDWDFGRGMALQPDGKIVIVGQTSNLSVPDFGIERFNADGTLDADFGTDGRLIVDFFGASDEATAVVIQPDGKIIVSGSAVNGTRVGVGMLRLVP